jgi:hypothetical protein
MIVRPTGQRLQRLRVARKTKSQNFSVTLNEMNPNKTKDFDLRQEDSVVYQRSRAVASQQCIKLSCSYRL